MKPSDATVTDPKVERRALLLTDVVDSTQLVRELGDQRAAEVWARHDTLARELLAPHNGLEIDKTDGFLLIFEDPSDAVRYALAYHAALAEISVELGVKLAARAGLHVGDVILRRNPADQVARGAKPLEVEGLAKPTAARVMSVASAAQTLVSADARDAIDLPELTVVSHGHWRMKGLDEPIELLEIGPEDAPFAPPADGAKVYRVVWTDGAWLPAREVPNDLGPPPDAFLGREAELKALGGALADGAPLVTITGPKGVGKARLALRYGRTRLGDWPAGVWQVDATQGLRGSHGGPCLVLVLHADRVPAETLETFRAQSPEATFVVTRRERLAVAGERVVPLPPLETDAALALFEARALATDPNASRDPAHAAVVVNLLGGLPGHVERAAVRSRAPGRHRPFLGLRSFRAEDSERFFGRDQEEMSLAKRVREDPLITVTGASGAGKSSLLQAGVRRHLPEFDIGVIRPGPTPMQVLLHFLEEAAPRAVGPVLSAVANGDATLQPRGRGSTGRTRPILLVVDQAEEMLTLTLDPEERTRFGLALVAFAALRGATVALAVREDFFARIADVGPLKGRYHQSLEVLTRPDPDALLQTLVMPAALFGHRFEPGLAEQMAEEVSGEPAALALLQFCADQLWERRDPDRMVLTREAYEAVGGVTGALAVHADQVVGALAPAERSEARRQFLRLISQQTTKEPRSRTEILDSAKDRTRAAGVLDSLIASRLLTVFEADDGGVMVEIVHEALLRHWERLAMWLGEDVEGQRMTRSLRDAAEEWSRRGRTRDLLWRGSLLLQLEEWRERAQPNLTSTEQAFADTSARVARRRRRMLWAGGLMSALVLILIALGSLSLWLRAERALVVADKATAEAIAEKENAKESARIAQAERERAEDKQREATEASAVALAARQDADTQRTAAEAEAQRASIQEMLAREAQLEAEQGARTILDAQRLFAVSELAGDPTRAAPFLAAVDPSSFPLRWRASVWEVLQRPLTLTATRVPLEPNRAAWAMGPSGERWAIAGAEGLVVWHARSNTRQTVGEPGTMARAVAWSPDGSTLAAATADGAVLLFRKQSQGWASPLRLEGHLRPAESLSFSGDGTRLVTASTDGTARVWSVHASGESTALAHGGAVWMARFIRDGTQVLTAAADGQVAVWDVDGASSQALPRIDGTTQAVATAASWDPATDRVVGAWSDRSLVVLDGERSERLEGSPSYVTEALFSGHGLVVREQAGGVSTWARGKEGGWRRNAIALAMTGARDIDLSPDGRWLAVVGSGGGAELHELARGRAVERTLLLGHDPGHEVIGVRFEPGSDRVTTIGADGTIRSWPVRGGGMSQRVDGLDGRSVTSLAYTAEGAVQVATEAGGTQVVPAHALQSPASITAVTLSTDGASAHILQGEAQPIPLLGHLGEVRATAVLDGRQVATAADDGTVRLWNLPDDETLAQRLRTLPIGCVQVHDRQRYLAEDLETARENRKRCLEGPITAGR